MIPDMYDAKRGLGRGLRPRHCRPTRAATPVLLAVEKRFLAGAVLADNRVQLLQTKEKGEKRA